MNNKIDHLEFDFYNTFPTDVNVIPKSMTHSIFLDMDPTSHQMVQYGLSKNDSIGRYYNSKNKKKKKYYKINKQKF